jgi:hypothetical protein
VSPNFPLIPLVLAGLAAGFVLPANAAGQSQMAIDVVVFRGDDARDRRFGGSVSGVGLDFIRSITPRIYVGVEGDIPKRRPYEKSTRLLYSDGAQSLFSERRTLRAPSAITILGVHGHPANWLDLAFVTGVGEEFRHEYFIQIQDSVNGKGQTIFHQVTDSSELEQIDRQALMTVGGDAAIMLGAHLALVPQWRFYFNPVGFLPEEIGGTLRRVRLVVRWRF